MAKTCADLFEGFNCTILGNSSEEVSGIAYRSDRVQPGDAFFCIVGLAVDGHSFAQDAIDRGAKVLIVERKLYLADATDVTEVVVADSRKALAYAAAQFYDNPSRAFSLVGVTGTNGKTTTTYLVEHIARMAGKKTGVIGTVGTTIGDVHEKSEHTTPESSDLQHLFARMRDAKCDCVAMEVSSHALDLCRTWDTRFSVTAFTNLTQDHLDYHHTFEAYFEAKARLFGKGSKERIVPLHDLAMDSLRRYALVARPKLLDGKECPYFFVSTRGNQMKTDAMRKMFKATVREAGLDDSLSPHDMRHTFATDLLNGGADVRSVQEMLGHAQLSTTQVYTHLSVERLKMVHDQALPR